MWWNAWGTKTREAHVPASLEELFATLQGRHRPEDVVRGILKVLGGSDDGTGNAGHADAILTKEEQKVLKKAARPVAWYSLMPTEFEAPVPLTHSTGVLCALLDLTPLSAEE